MANSEFTVYVPDRSQPFHLPGSLTDEEIRRCASGMGYPSVENADLITSSDGLTKTFRRPTGGTKG